jgi:hypothetical protein
MKESKGLRFNEGKVPMELVPPSLIFATAKVLQKGAEKYAPRNWEKGMKWTVVSGCLLRHFYKWMSPLHSDFDEETGLNHLWHVACNVAMLIEYENTCKDLDDRVKYTVDSTPHEWTDEELEEFYQEYLKRKADNYYDGKGNSKSI